MAWKGPPTEFFWPLDPEEFYDWFEREYGHKIGSTFPKQFHPGMRRGERILFDGSVTDKPKNYNLPITEWDEQEVWDHYSANYEWLQMFIDFCRRCEGFKIY